MKYTSIRQLKDAYDSGEIPRNCRIIVDNDYAVLYDEDENPIWRGGGPEMLLMEAFEVLNIPADQA